MYNENLLYFQLPLQKYLNSPKSINHLVHYENTGVKANIADVGYDVTRCFLTKHYFVNC